MTQSLSHQPILLIGATGMLGRAWQQCLQDQGLAFAAPSSKELDLTDPDAIERYLDPSVQTVINCAAYTAVDDAEKEQAQATALNGHAVGNLARRCKQINATLVHYSTDYVFDGQAQTPYPTDTPRQPINAYGQSKAVGEEQIQQAGCKHLIIRTSWLYAPWGNNFVRTIAKLAQERETLAVVNDQLGRPTSCQTLVEVTQQLLQKQAMGIYHVCDDGQCTWYEFAQEIVSLTAANCEVTPCSTDAFPRPATRPAYSVLNLTQTQNTVGPLTHWKQNLKAVCGQLAAFSKI